MDLVYSFPRHYAEDARPANGCLANPEGIDLEALERAIARGEGINRPGFARFFYKQIAYFERKEVDREGGADSLLMPVTYAQAVSEWMKQGGSPCRGFNAAVRELPYAFIYPITFLSRGRDGVSFRAFLNERLVQNFSEAVGCRLPDDIQREMEALMNSDPEYRNDIAFYSGFPQMLDQGGFVCTRQAERLLRHVKTFRALSVRFGINDYYMEKVFEWVIAADHGEVNQVMEIPVPEGEKPELNESIVAVQQLRNTLIPDSVFDEHALGYAIQMGGWTEGQPTECVLHLTRLSDWRYHTFDFQELFKVIKKEGVTEISSTWAARVDEALDSLVVTGQSKLFLKVLHTPIDGSVLERAVLMLQTLREEVLEAEDAILFFLRFENNIKYVDAHPEAFAILKPQDQLAFCLKAHPAFPEDTFDEGELDVYRQRVRTLEERFRLSHYGKFRLLVHCTSKRDAICLDHYVPPLHDAQQFVGEKLETDTFVELAMREIEISHLTAFIDAHRAQQQALIRFYHQAEPGSPFPSEVGLALMEANALFLGGIQHTLVRADAFQQLTFPAFVQSGVCLDNSEGIADRVAIEPKTVNVHTFGSFGRTRDGDLRRVVCGWRREEDRFVFDVALVKTPSFHTCLASAKLPFDPEVVGEDNIPKLFKHLKKAVRYELASMCTEGKPVIPREIEAFEGAIDHWLSELQFQTGKGVVELSSGAPLTKAPVSGGFSLHPFGDGHFSFIEGGEGVGVSSVDLPQALAVELQENEEIAIELGVYMFDELRPVMFQIHWEAGASGRVWHVSSGDIVLAIEFPDSMIESEIDLQQSLNWMIGWVKGLVYNRSRKTSPVHPSARPRIESHASGNLLTSTTSGEEGSSSDGSLVGSALGATIGDEADNTSGID